MKVTIITLALIGAASANNMTVPGVIEAESASEATASTMPTLYDVGNFLGDLGAYIGGLLFYFAFLAFWSGDMLARMIMCTILGGDWCNDLYRHLVVFLSALMISPYLLMGDFFGILRAIAMYFFGNVRAIASG